MTLMTGILSVTVLAALLAVEMPSLLLAVIAFGVMGAGLCSVPFLLGEFDLGLIQLAVEISLLVVLVRTTVSAKDERREWLAGIFAIIALLLCALALFGDLKSFSVAAVPAAKSGERDLFSMIGVAAAFAAAVVGWFAVLRPEGKQK